MLNMNLINSPICEDDSQRCEQSDQEQHELLKEARTSFQLNQP